MLVQNLCRVGLAFIYSAGSRIVALLCHIEKSCFKFLWVGCKVSRGNVKQNSILFLMRRIEN